MSDPAPAAAALRHPLLSERGIDHGFGVRGAPVPDGVVRPRQVHGAQVAGVAACRGAAPQPADAVVSREPGVRVAVVTADCLPILLSTRCGTGVAAIHAGWRGLASGVVEAGVAALRGAHGAPDGLLAVVGPHIGPCCYEVDAPVLEALGRRFGAALEGALRPTRPGHARLDLGALARDALRAAGVAADSLGALADACTGCDPQRFHSYRRDGPRAGRMLHFIAARPEKP